ncbi:hypothetical protein ACFQZR_06995 [Paenibacillus sp. GCM10027629]|uniref:hypothetical protein n=1 Tax=Paenibacillus sp. GCM10027629 TaxID=3273414 RepID=UPI0036294454
MKIKYVSVFLIAFLILIAGCSTSEKNPSGSPKVWIFYKGEKYEGAKVYASKPDNIISTNTFTQEKDYMPDKEIFMNQETQNLFTHDKHEWTEFKKISIKGGK